MLSPRYRAVKWKVDCSLLLQKMNENQSVEVTGEISFSLAEQTEEQSR